MSLLTQRFKDKSGENRSQDDRSYKSNKSQTTAVSTLADDSSSEGSRCEEAHSQRSSTKSRASSSKSRRSSSSKSHITTLSHKKRKQAAEDTYARLQAQSDEIQRLTESNDRRQDAVDKLTYTTNITRSKRSKYALEINKGMQQLILGGVRSLFRTAKFLIDEQDGLAAMKVVLYEIPQWANTTGRLESRLMMESVKEHWDLYGNDLNSKLNQQRTDASNGVRGCWLQAWKMGFEPPNPEEYLKLVCRSGLKFDPKDPKLNEHERALFAWHVDAVICKVATKDFWPQGVRHYSTPSTALVPTDLSDTKKKKAIPAGTEAMCVLIVENAYERWSLEWDLRQANKIPPGKELKHVVDLGDPDKPGSGNPDHIARFPTKYTNCRAGKAEFGAWSHAGRKRFKELEAMISDCRRKKWARKAELQALADIQVKHKIHERVANKTREKKVVSQKDRDEARVAIGVESDVEPDDDDDEEEEEESDEEVAKSGPTSDQEEEDEDEENGQTTLLV